MQHKAFVKKKRTMIVKKKRTMIDSPTDLVSLVPVKFNIEVMDNV